MLTIPDFSEGERFLGRRQMPKWVCTSAVRNDKWEHTNWRLNGIRDLCLSKLPGRIVGRRHSRTHFFNIRTLYKFSISDKCKYRYKFSYRTLPTESEKSLADSLLGSANASFNFWSQTSCLQKKLNGQDPILQRMKSTKLTATTKSIRCLLRFIYCREQFLHIAPLDFKFLCQTLLLNPPG